VADPLRAIYRFSDFGPTFGFDITISQGQDSRSFFGQYYSVPSGVQHPFTILAGAQFFTPDDWEVFYLA